MRIQLIVRLRPESDLVSGSYALEWCWLNKDRLIDGDIYQGSLSELVTWRESLELDEQDLPVHLLVSGHMSSCHRMSLNENQRKHWQQALPYLLEEQLASDLESLHLVSFAETGQEFVNAGCIARKQMETLLDQFISAGIDPQKVMPENQFLTRATDIVSVWLERDAAYIAAPGHFGQLLDRDALSVVLPGLLADDEPADTLQDDDAEAGATFIITGVKVYHGAGDAEAVAMISNIAGGDVPVEDVERSQPSLLPDMLSELAGRGGKSSFLDFRTGDYKCTRRASRRWRQWRPLAIAAGLWLGLELLFNVGTGFYFQNRAEALRDENFATYRELRPDDRRVADVRYSLTRFLRDANNQGSEAVFLGMLKTLSQVSSGETGKNITPRNMDFNDANGRLSMDVQAGSFDALNRYLDKLKEAGLNAKMETGNQDAQGVSARLTVRSA